MKTIEQIGKPCVALLNPFRGAFHGGAKDSFRKRIKAPYKPLYANREKINTPGLVSFFPLFILLINSI